MSLKNKIEKVVRSKNKTSVHQQIDDLVSKEWMGYSFQIARRVIAQLKEKDISQIKLAFDLNVKPQRISKILKGRENLTLETIYNLSKSLNCDLITFPPYKYTRTWAKQMTSEDSLKVCDGYDNVISIRRAPYYSLYQNALNESSEIVSEPSSDYVLEGTTYKLTANG